MLTFIAIFIGLVIVFLIIVHISEGIAENKRLSKMTFKERMATHTEDMAKTKQKLLADLEWQHGKRNSAMHCPQCQTTGQVHTRRIKSKKGISGGKATAAVLTGGVSLLATGLSRKEAETKAFCAKCKSVWHF